MPFTRAPSCATAPRENRDTNEACGGQPARRRQRATVGEGRASHRRAEGLLHAGDVFLAIADDADDGVAHAQEANVGAAGARGVGVAESDRSGNDEEGDAVPGADIVEVGDGAVARADRGGRPPAPDRRLARAASGDVAALFLEPRGHHRAVSRPDLGGELAGREAVGVVARELPGHDRGGAARPESDDGQGRRDRKQPAQAVAGAAGGGPGVLRPRSRLGAGEPAGPGAGSSARARSSPGRGRSRTWQGGPPTAARAAASRAPST